MVTSYGRRAVIALTGAVASIGLGVPISSGSDSGDRDDDTSTDAERHGESKRDDEKADGLVTVEGSGESVSATVDCLTQTINEQGLTVMTTVDHAANAASVDKDLPPMTVILFGNPKIGTELMQRQRTVGIDLPQKPLVWKDEGTVRVSYNDPNHTAERHRIDGADDLLEKVATALQSIAMADCCGD